MLVGNARLEDKVELVRVGRIDVEEILGLERVVVNEV